MYLIRSRRIRTVKRNRTTEQGNGMDAFDSLDLLRSTLGIVFDVGLVRKQLKLVLMCLRLACVGRVILIWLTLGLNGVK